MSSSHLMFNKLTKSSAKSFYLLEIALTIKLSFRTDDRFIPPTVRSILNKERTIGAEKPINLCYLIHFRYHHKCLVHRVLSQGYITLKLEKSFKKFYGRYQDLIEKYQVS